MVWCKSSHDLMVLEKRIAGMWQMYSCPHCRAPVAYGVRFCSNCGINLEQQMPSQPSRFAYCYQSNPQQIGEQRQSPYIQQTGWRQQPGQNQPPPHNEAPVRGTPMKCQQRDRSSCGAHPQEKRSTVDGTMTPMRAEISKLLADLFDRHIDHSS